MSNPNPVNFAASAYAKLKNIAHAQNKNFMHLLTRYAIERFLYRLSVSAYANQFVLKGGNLFVIWQKGDSCPTLDSDLQCFGESSPEYLKDVFTEIVKTQESNEDGMRYDETSIEITPILEDTEYGGTRVLMFSYLGNARIRLQFDIGIGDAITPHPENADFPVLLNGLVPHLRIYPMATVIAEKAEIMVSRDIRNSRMKDFCDIWILSEEFDHDFKTLRSAILNTFKRRDVKMPVEIPQTWNPGFSDIPAKNIQWAAFLKGNPDILVPTDFRIVCERISQFLIPVFFPPEQHPLKWIAAKGWT